MKKTTIVSAALISLALASVAASDSVCRNAEIEFDGIEAPVLAFAWGEKPAPLAKGIMFETLVDRPKGDGDFVAVVDGGSCEAWKRVSSAGSQRLELRFLDTAGQMLVLGDGNALGNVVSCGDGGTTIVFKVDRSFNIGMPPT